MAGLIKHTMRDESMGRTTLTCKLSTLSSGSSSSIKLISATDDTLYKFHKPLRAADVMVQNPGWFVCDSAQLGVGLRVPGLTADEKLIPSRLYFLLPLDLLYSVLTDEEMDSLSYKASIAFKKGGNYLIS
jgi:PADRE domain